MNYSSLKTRFSVRGSRGKTLTPRRIIGWVFIIIRKSKPASRVADSRHSETGNKRPDDFTSDFKAEVTRVNLAVRFIENRPRRNDNTFNAFGRRRVRVYGSFSVRRSKKTLSNSCGIQRFDVHSPARIFKDQAVQKKINDRLQHTRTDLRQRPVSNGRFETVSHSRSSSSTDFNRKTIGASESRKRFVFLFPTRFAMKLPIFYSF